MRLDGHDPELAPESVLPAQFYARPAAPGRPEQRLMLAVLDRAIWELQKYTHEHTRRALRLRLELEAWFASDDESWPYAFVNLCRGLHIDPDYLRRGVAQRRNARYDANVLRARIRRIATGPRTITLRTAGLRRAV